MNTQTQTQTQTNTQTHLVEFNTAELIEWGYLTGGDFDEALRNYAESVQRNGNRAILDIPDNLAAAKRTFKQNFSRH